MPHPASEDHTPTVPPTEASPTRRSPDAAAPAVDPGNAQDATVCKPVPAAGAQLPKGTVVVGELVQPAGLESRPGPVTPEAQGRPFGRYRLREALGSGGMGVVYKAWDTALARMVALKLIRSDAASPDGLVRFQREARLAAKLRHPNVIPVHDVGECDGQQYLTMDFVAGVTFARFLDELREPKSLRDPAGLRRLRQEVSILADVANAVAYAHGEGVIHRDLKPANVLLDGAEKPYVMDFGLAKDVGAEAAPTRVAGLTNTGAMMGTPAYMSPEQARGAVAEIGPRSDVWALGVMLYEILTGVTPFEESAAIWEVLRAIADQEPVAPRVRHPHVPLELEAVCLKALDKAGERRYRTAAEFEAELRRWLRGEPVEARRPGTTYRLWRRAVRYRGWVAAAAVLLMLLLAVGVSAWSAARLRERLQGEMRTKAELYLDAALDVRRAGAPLDRVREKYLPRLEATVRELERVGADLAEPHYRLGRLYRAVLDFDGAAREQERALESDPEFAPSRYERAVLGAHEYDVRREEVRRHARLAVASAGPDAHADPGAHRADAAKGDAALERLRKRICDDLAHLEHGLRDGSGALTPGRLACAKGLHLFYTGTTDAERREALAALERAREEDPSLEEAHHALGMLYSADGRWEEAVDAFTRGLEADRGYAPHWVGRATARRNAAVRDLRRVEDADALYDGALGDLGQALELSPSLHAVRVGRGELHNDVALFRMEHGRSPEEHLRAALADFDRVLADQPARTGAWIGRAATQVNWGLWDMGRGEDPRARFAAADADLIRALALDASQPAAQVYRGNVRLNEGLYLMLRGEDAAPAYAAALEAFDAALRLEPSASTYVRRGTVQTNWAWHLEQRGGSGDERRAGAIADLTRALELEPEWAEAWIDRGMTRAAQALHDAGRGRDAAAGYAVALADLDHAIGLAPAHAKAWLRRGEARVNLGIHRHGKGDDPSGLFEQAIEDFGKAIELNPADATAWTYRGNGRKNLGSIRWARGVDPVPWFTAAQADYDEALKLDPTAVEALTARASLAEQWAARAQAAGADPRPHLEAALRDLEAAAKQNPGRTDLRPWIEGLRAALAAAGPK